jgi:hypothetical protein
MRSIMFVMRAFGALLVAFASGARGRFLMNLGTALSTWLGASSVYALEPLDQRSSTASRTSGCLDTCLYAQRTRASRATSKGSSDEGEEEDELDHEDEPALTA